MKPFDIPVPKPDKDPIDPTNYRPITMTRCICNTVNDSSLDVARLKLLSGRLSFIIKNKFCISFIGENL